MRKRTGQIETIEGQSNPNIIVVAPHGYKGDDDNTGKLARAIQKRLGCHAIINEAFKKPKKDKKTGKYVESDIENRLADLNYKPHAEQHPDFITSLKKKISDPENTYVFWIHGISDDNLKTEAEKLGNPDINCLIGYGQPDENRHSMTQEKAREFAKFLNDCGMPAKATHDQSKDYRGATLENMNQYFNQNGANMSGVQSVQLEFGEEGIRKGYNIRKSGLNIAKAISSLTGCKAADIPEDKPDEDLVLEATDQIMDIVKSNHKNSIGVGKYLIEKFYGNDYEKARLGKKAKKESLNQTYETLKKMDDAPSKSWFYNAVNLAVDDKEFKNDPNYNKLNHSQKLYLTYLNKKEAHRKARHSLIEEIAKDGMSIDQLKDKVSEIKSENKVGLLESKLDEMDSDEIEKMITRAKKRADTIQKSINTLEQKLANKKAELKKHQEFVDKAEKRLVPN